MPWAEDQQVPIKAGLLAWPQHCLGVELHPTASKEANWKKTKIKFLNKGLFCDAQRCPTVTPHSVDPGTSASIPGWMEMVLMVLCSMLKHGGFLTVEEKMRFPLIPLSHPILQTLGALPACCSSQPLTSVPTFPFPATAPVKAC